jgi:hypothetical protein
MVVGAVGFMFNWKADRRAGREEARALRAERLAEEAERRAADAERRAEEAHAWDRERREAEQARARAQRHVVEKKRTHGTAHSRCPSESWTSREPPVAAGFLDLRELQDSDGTVVDAMASVSGSLIVPG